ncbi:MAG TPA: hypothetical protein VHC90_00905 [Bryobacteraceae bacterium]|nr:hypothetical protein [Bryobacteraceae bacterium]
MTPKTAALLADPHPKTHIVYPIGDLFLNDAPDPAAFDSIVGAAVRQGIANSPAGKVRICGEMVNDLCSSDRAEAAAHMEELWNTLDEAQYVPVLCSYSLDPLLPLGMGLRDRLPHAHNHDLSPGDN